MNIQNNKLHMSKRINRWRYHAPVSHKRGERSATAEGEGIFHPEGFSRGKGDEGMGKGGKAAEAYSMEPERTQRGFNPQQQPRFS